MNVLNSGKSPVGTAKVPNLNNRILTQHIKGSESPGRWCHFQGNEVHMEQRSNDLRPTMQHGYTMLLLGLHHEGRQGSSDGRRAADLPTSAP